MRDYQLRCLKELEKENVRLRWAVSIPTLDKQALKEAAQETPNLEKDLDLAHERWADRRIAHETEQTVGGVERHPPLYGEPYHEIRASDLRYPVRRISARHGPVAGRYCNTVPKPKPG